MRRVSASVRIAFDLDDTLIPTGHRFATEPPRGPWWLRGLASEHLRDGTGALLHDLRDAGHSLCVYTSSARSVFAVHATFRAYGVSLERVVNLDRHEAACRGASVRRVKFLRAFGIDLLIDDSEAVELDAARHGERVLRVACDDLLWADRVREAARTLRGPHA